MKTSRSSGRNHHSAARRHVLHRRIRAAKPLHQRALLHPAGIMALLVIGVLIAGWTIGVAADDYSVTGKVPAPLLTEGAIITAPSNGDIFTASPITVSGSCPDNSYVKLSRNDSFSGVAVCTANTFNIDTSLSPGSNVLLAQDFNSTDDAGPTTLPVTVSYNPPPVPVAASSPTPNIAASAPASPPTLSSDYHFQSFATGDVFSWGLRVSGGAAPYLVHIDWGDHTVADQTYPAATDVTITHRYEKPGSYVIRVTLRDATGYTTLLQLIALIKLPGAPSFLIAPGSGAQPPSGVAALLNNILATLVSAKYFLWIAWPFWIILTLMAASFYLGERQELHKLLAAQPIRSRSHNR